VFHGCSGAQRRAPNDLLRISPKATPTPQAFVLAILYIPLNPYIHLTGRDTEQLEVSYSSNQYTRTKADIMGQAHSPLV
jgi:hypothetical protein